MRFQLQWLVDIAQIPNVYIHVLPPRGRRITASSFVPHAFQRETDNYLHRYSFNRMIESALSGGYSK
jgi:hypothetical protein